MKVTFSNKIFFVLSHFSLMLIVISEEKLIKHKTEPTSWVVSQRLSSKMNILCFFPRKVITEYSRGIWQYNLFAGPRCWRRF